MDIIFAKHHRNEFKEYCFEVPVEIKKQLKKDMMIFVNTKYGKQVAYTTTRVISGSGAVDVATKNGATYPLQRVISFVPLECEKMLGNDIKDTVVDKIEHALCEIRFSSNVVSPYEDYDLPF
jgi:hypothetical protein